MELATFAEASAAGGRKSEKIPDSKKHFPIRMCIY